MSFVDTIVLATRQVIPICTPPNAQTMMPSPTPMSLCTLD